MSIPNFEPMSIELAWRKHNNSGLSSSRFEQKKAVAISYGFYCFAEIRAWRVTKGRRFLASFGAEARKLSMIFARRFVALFGRHRYGLTVRRTAAGCSVRPQGGGPGFGRMEEAARTAGVSCPSGKAGGESFVENESRRTFPLAVSVSAGSAVSTVGLGRPRRTVTVLKRDRAYWFRWKFGAMRTGAYTDFPEAYCRVR